MPVLILETKINADIQIVFNLARSIDLHKISTEHTNEEAIAGVTEGLIGDGEFVTWRAKHFGFYQTLTSKITKFESPVYFVDEMIQGAFKSFKHAHHFKDKNGITIMKDIFDYNSPLGFLGKIADILFLKRYMTKLLEKRNAVVKEYAETNKWKKILN